MSKIDEVRSEMMAAMKAHDKERKDALSALLTALKNKFIDKRADLTEEEENEVVLRAIKSISSYVGVNCILLVVNCILLYFLFNNSTH